MQFNEKLKELRAKKGVSQSKLAESIYVSRSAVAKWENGLGLPSGESLRLLSEYFGESTDELCSDAHTEKVIVQKNRIISRSRKLLIIISTACAVAFTAIIALAVVLGFNITATEKNSEDDIANLPFSVKGELYSGARYDYDNNRWTVPYDRWEYISGKSEECPACGIPQVLYDLNVGEEYVLSVRPSPSGYDGYEFGIYADCVNAEYDSDIFEVFRGIPEQQTGERVDYVLKIKKPCNRGSIKLYYGKEATEKTDPKFLFVINAALSVEGDA